MILITHTDADHMDPAILKTLKKASTVIVTVPAVADTLNGAAGEVETISNEEKKTNVGIEIEAMPMYNPCSDPRRGSRFTIKSSETATCRGRDDHR